jgi:nucleoside 2-deoxyribosyltransferase
MRIYIAAPLFNESERTRNQVLRDTLKALGHETYLPQEDGDIAFDEITKGADIRKTRQKIFEHDMAEVKRCDILLCVLDGRVPDEGVCVELGMAYALGKKCIGYLTDSRSFDAYGPNLMIEGCLTGIAHSVEEIVQLLQ